MPTTTLYNDSGPIVIMSLKREMPPFLFPSFECGFNGVTWPLGRRGGGGRSGTDLHLFPHIIATFFKGL